MVSYPVRTGEPPAWKPFATKALHLGIEGHYQAAADEISEMCRRLGDDVISAVMLAWIDTTLHATGVEEYGRPTQPRWKNARDGQIGDADQVPAVVAWAGRLIAARASDDQDTYNALCDAVPDGGWGEHVMALLNVVTTTLRGGPVR